MIDINELIKILSEVRSLIESNSTDICWSRYGTVNEALEDIDSHIVSLQNNDLSRLLELKTLFAPTGSFQEISINSGWSELFLNISNRFDGAIVK